jgi:hypothetical protein
LPVLRPATHWRQERFLIGGINVHKRHACKYVPTGGAK